MSSTKNPLKYSNFSQILLFLIFFFSGFAALIYQVIWQRWLVFYTGISSISISLIVSAFMAGLGLGYLIGGQIADKVGKNKPVLFFILAETGIGIFALLSKSIIYDWLYQSNTLQASSTLQIYSVLFLVLLFPTFLMGLSLPLLSRAFQLKNTENQANYISFLYFTNTLGAASGAFITAFILIRGVGFENAVRIGAFLNFLCAGAAGYIFLRKQKEENSETITANKSNSEGGFSWNKNFLYWVIQYTLSGFMAICFEVIWFRMLETMMKSVALTFSIILAIYLATMAFGTYVGVKYAKKFKGNRLRLFLNAQYILYLYTIASIAILLFVVKDVSAFSFLLDYFKSYEVSFAPKISAFTLLIIPVFLMAVPTFLMGFSFTISQLLIQDKFEEVGRKVGWLQFMNIVGSTTGAWFATLVGFNHLGTANTIKIIGLLGLIYVFVLYRNRLANALRLGIMGIVLVGFIGILPNNLNFWMTLSGMKDESKFILKEDETALSTIKITGDEAFVFINGLGQSMFPYHKDDTHIILGAIPALLHPNPQDIAIIGLGSASTVYNAGGRPETNKIDCFEVIINQPDAILEYVGRSKDSAAYRIMNDKRVNMILQDGRYVLHRDEKKYDIIEADALRPKSSFSGNLYSVEYFELMKSRLKKGGFAITWGATDRIDNGFKSVFSYVYKFKDFMLIGSDQPLNLDKETIKKRLSESFTAQYFGKENIDIQAMMAQVLASKKVLQEGAVKASDKVNRDMWPKDEYDFGRIWAYLGVD